MSLCRFLINTIILWKLCSGATIRLDGEWKFVNSNKSIQSIGHVPGGIYTDLQRNKLIGEPYYRFNDVNYRWIAKDSWTYFRNFTVSSNAVNYNKINLVCEGLDTVSSIFINGKLIGTSDNMFITYIFDIKSYLKKGVNGIEIQFVSPIMYSKEKYDKFLHEKYPVYPICPLPVQHGECHPNFIRKIQSQFSWDWGPAFPSVGIWKNISIEAYNEVKLRNVLVFTEEENNIGNKWRIDLKVFLDCDHQQTGDFTVYLNSKEQFKKPIELALPSDNGPSALNISFPVTQHVETWWPNGLGNQTMYNLTVVYESETGWQSIKSLNIGFRTVKLIQENITNAEGLTFYFAINGVPTFMKGSNWIPADSFPERISVNYIRRLLQSAKDANMNMLRVWGGGMYESDDFYRIADELGIMLWQDLMFACALYPTSDEFLASVTTEVNQQIQRLQHHPSIVVWSGNNENEAGLIENWWPTKSKFEQYKSDYVKLYINLIRPVVMELDPSRPFLSSSPSNGLETEKEGWLAKDPQSNLYGDVHFYDYLNDSWDWRIFPTPRFASEYGFQSWPSFETLAKVSTEEDWNYCSNFVSSRQHHLLGNTEILSSIGLHMHLPKDCSLLSYILNLCTSTISFKSILYLSQIYQAMSIKLETEHYLRSQNTIANNEGMTMGALYWQLNDIWQAPSWSSIEYGGKWKMLHYYAVNFFSSVVVSPFINDKRLQGYVITDPAFQESTLIVDMNVYRWEHFNSTFHYQQIYTQKSNYAQLVVDEDLDEMLKEAGCPNRNYCFLCVTVSTPDLVILNDNFLIMSSFKDAVGLKKPNITVSVIGNDEQGSEYDFALELTSDAVAPFVWLEASGISGRFSDNGFLLVTPKIQVVFHSWENVTAAKLAESLTVQSLLDAN